MPLQYLRKRKTKNKKTLTNIEDWSGVPINSEMRKRNKLINQGKEEG